MDTAKKIAASIAFLKKHGHKVSKTKKKLKSYKAVAFASTVAPVAGAMFKGPKVKNITLRKIFLKTIKTKYFNDVLDEYYKGSKRIAFDDMTAKKWTLKTVVQDIKTAGQFKRFKLVERYCIWNLEALRAMFEEGYRPAGDKVVIRKRKYKKANSRK